ncbi:MAG TPA: hypothetical protein VFV96_12775 [Verrucomicrobiae bacterium]|nr:hypothetical protein [Verrucomicrobiae bacterium]
MKIAAAFALTLIAAAPGLAQLLPTATTAACSATGQFTVTAPRVASWLRATGPVGTNTDWVRLEPTYVAISAERIKQAVWRDLGISGGWQQRVAIALQPARSADERVTIVSDRSPGGWSYRVLMPDQLTRERYLRAMVQVVLLEVANRTAQERSAEIPSWLAEGLLFELLSNEGAELVLNPPHRSANGVFFHTVTTDARQLSPLEKAHKILLGSTPLTFEELSWPAPGQLDGPGGPAYRASAQLFVSELLALPDGPACLRDFLATLPNYLNWQMAFLRAFKPHFSRPLDIEKWWALQGAEFAGRDLTQTWPYEESWRKLASAVRQRVDVFAATNQLPKQSEVKLQAVIQEWEPARRDQVLRDKLMELISLRLRLAPELAPLATQYAETLDAWFKLREAPAPSGKMPRATDLALRRNGRALAQRLDVLDALLEKARPQSLAGNAPAPR